MQIESGQERERERGRAVEQYAAQSRSKVCSIYLYSPFGLRKNMSAILFAIFNVFCRSEKGVGELGGVTECDGGGSCV